MAGIIALARSNENMPWELEVIANTVPKTK
jgi:hypothetical protein